MAELSMKPREHSAHTAGLEWGSCSPPLREGGTQRCSREGVPRRSEHCREWHPRGSSRELVSLLCWCSRIVCLESEREKVHSPTPLCIPKVDHTVFTSL
jgi:hypothetical protein